MGTNDEVAAASIIIMIKQMIMGVTRLLEGPDKVSEHPPIALALEKIGTHFKIRSIMSPEVNKRHTFEIRLFVYLFKEHVTAIGLLSWWRAWSK